MASLPNGLETAERGSTVWRIIYNQNFQELDAKLGGLATDYYTKAQSNARYYTKTEIDTNVYTKTEVDSDIYSKTESNARYYTKTEIDTNVYTKTEVDTDFISKSDLGRTKHSLAYAGSWETYSSSYEALAVTSDSYGLVNIQGVVKSGAVGSVIATLPAGYRPGKARKFIVAAGGDTAGFITVGTNGDITFDSGDNTMVSLELTFVI